MNLTRDRIRSIGWIVILTICAGLTAGLALRVNAVKSQVHETEKRVVALRQEINFLDTEFQTRASQQQLKLLNDVEFGFSAPRAAQYIEGERQLAALGKPRGPGAPSPIRVASHLESHQQSTPFLAMVSPIMGVADAHETEDAKADAAADHDGDAIGSVIDAETLAARLARIELPKPKAGEE